MAKKITFEYGGKTWVLEFNARTVKEVQASGFKKDDIGDKSLIMLPLLWHGAFLMHHRGEKAKTIDDMLPLMGDKMSLFEKLVQMYDEPVEALIDEPDDESVKVNWTASW
jgi:hypothetical protein